MKQIDRRESAATSLEKQSQMRVFPSLRVSGLLFVPLRTRSQSFLSCPSPRQLLILSASQTISPSSVPSAPLGDFFCPPALPRDTPTQ
jgi:hypothetical protein